MEHLLKVRGKSFEDMLAILEEKSIFCSKRKYPSLSHKYTTTKYFRDSLIQIPEESFASLILPHGTHYWMDKATVRAYYHIQPGFDTSKLDGAIYFYNGLLVERTIIQGVDDYTMKIFK